MLWQNIDIVCIAQNIGFLQLYNNIEYRYIEVNTFAISVRYLSKTKQNVPWTKELAHVDILLFLSLKINTQLVQNCQTKSFDVCVASCWQIPNERSFISSFV